MHECHLSGLFVVKPNKTVLTAKASTLLGLLFVPNILTMSVTVSSNEIRKMPFVWTFCCQAKQASTLFGLPFVSFLLNNKLIYLLYQKEILRCRCISFILANTEIRTWLIVMIRIKY